MRQHLTSCITGFDRPRYFQDTMIEGAFEFMQHDHFFIPVSASLTEMSDRFVFAAPLPTLGLLAERFFLKRYMVNLLDNRNEVLKSVAESANWARFI